MNIDANQLEKDIVTYEDVATILSYYEEKSFDSISINNYSDTMDGTIYKEIVNACVLYLKEAGENRSSSLSIKFTNKETRAGQNWIMSNPSTQASDQVVSAEIEMSESGVYISFSELALEADSVTYNYDIYKENSTDEYEFLCSLLGELTEEYTYKQISVGDSEAYSNWRGDLNSATIQIGDIQNLAPNKKHEITPYVYRGSISEYDNGEKFLYLSIDGLTLDEIKEIVSYYQKKGMEFAGVTIEQKHTNSDIIRKELINETRKILKNSNESGNVLNFVFSNNGDENNDSDWENIQWCMESPGIATKDINANINLESQQGAGLSVYLPQNTYNAGDIRVDYWLGDESELYSQVLVPGLGKARDMETDTLRVFENMATFREDITATYTCYEADRMVSFTLWDVANWKGNVDNRLIRPIVYPEEIAIYETITLPVYAESNPNNEDPDLSVKSIEGFKLLTPDFATLDGDKFTPMVTGVKIYTLLTYTSKSGKTCYEMLELTSVKKFSKVGFKDHEVSYEWDGQETDVPCYSLEMDVKPASLQNEMDISVMTWSVEGNSITLVQNEYAYTDENGNWITEMRYDGSFKINGYGTSVITMTYGEFTDSCTVTVTEPVDIPDLPAIYAIPAVYDTLGDVDLDKQTGSAEGTWEWKHPDMSLANYTDVNSHLFTAIYSAPDGRQKEVTIFVEMIRPENLDIIGVSNVQNDEFFVMDDYVMYDGEEVMMSYKVVTNHPAEDENGTTKAYELLQESIANGELAVQWSSKEAFEVVVHPIFDSVIKYVSGGKAGKKKFTASLVNTKTGKTILKENVTVTLAKNTLFYFEEPDFVFSDLVSETDALSGTFRFDVTAENYRKLSFKSMDTSVLKLGKVNTEKTEAGNYVITVPYTYKKYGKTLLKVTASDEVKSSWTTVCERIDKAPKVLTTSFTLDKSWSDKESARVQCPINFGYHETAAASGEPYIKETEYREKISIEKDDSGYWLVLNDLSLTGKTHSMTVVMPAQGVEDAQCEAKIKVKVTESTAKIKVKQTQKVNEFYVHSMDSVEGIGVLTVDDGRYELSSFYPLNANTAFELNQLDGNTYEVRIREGYDPAAKEKVEFSYSLYDSASDKTYFDTVVVTIQTQDKAPKLTLSSKSSTLYPNAGMFQTAFGVYNQNTGQSIDFSAEQGIAQIIVSGKAYDVPFSGETSQLISIGKNAYSVSLSEKVDITINDSGHVKSTDKFKLGIQLANWKRPVEVGYSVKVNVKTPKLTLTGKTLTLNKNENIYTHQLEKTNVNVQGMEHVSWELVWISGTNEKASRLLRNHLSVNVTNNNEIYVAISDIGDGQNNSSLDTGKYKFNVFAKLNNQKYSTTLTINIVDKPSTKAIKVTKKGSIDILRREDTQIVMNPKISNLSGKVVGFHLEGEHGVLFDSYQDENGNCIIKAVSDIRYSTKVSYKLLPVYTFATDWGTYEVAGAQQTIKLTQGIPKVTASSTGNVLYADKGNSIRIDFTATLKEQAINMESIELLNYTNDLNCYYDGVSSVYISANGNMQDIVKAKGTYPLKFAITYREGTDHDKKTNVTYKATIVQ